MTVCLICLTCIRSICLRVLLLRIGLVWSSSLTNLFLLLLLLRMQLILGPTSELWWTAGTGMWPHFIVIVVLFEHWFIMLIVLFTLGISVFHLKSTFKFSRAQHSWHFRDIIPNRAVGCFLLLLNLNIFLPQGKNLFLKPLDFLLQLDWMFVFVFIRNILASSLSVNIAYCSLQLLLFNIKLWQLVLWVLNLLHRCLVFLSWSI